MPTTMRRMRARAARSLRPRLEPWSTPATTYPIILHPGEEPDSNYYRPLHDPVMAYAGNCVIIDHGNSEYSVMMHMQQGSVTVKAGDRVVTGQVIGRLGNSGDSFGPHLHYQLQSGPRLWSTSRCRSGFKTSMLTLHRGQYFVAK